MRAEDCDSVRRWREGLGPASFDKYWLRFREWLRWLGERGGALAGLSPDELVAFQRVNKDYQVLDMIQGFVGEGGGRRHMSKVWTMSVLRSFFAHNRAELPRDSYFRVRAEEPPVEKLLNVDVFRRILDSSSPLYRAVFLCMLQGGMGENEVVYWSNHGWEGLKRQLDRDVHPLKVDLPGRKRYRFQRSFYTFLGRDAKEALIHWVGERPLSKAIFATQYGRPLTASSVYAYWMRHLLRLGVVSRPAAAGQGTRYGMNPHRIRGIFRTRWRPSGADVEVAEFLMGHDITALGYDHSPWDEEHWFEEQYLRAEPWLNVVSEAPEKVTIGEYNRAKREYERKLEDLNERIRRAVAEELERLRQMGI